MLTVNESWSSVETINIHCVWRVGITKECARTKQDVFLSSIIRWSSELEVHAGLIHSQVM